MAELSLKTALTVQIEQIPELMDNMNAFNLGKKCEMLLKELAKWIPQVASFDKQIKQVERENQDLQDTIKRLKEDKNSLQDRVYVQRESNETTYAIKNWSRIIMM